MSVEGATRDNARSWFVRGRLVGAAAIAFAVSVVIENAVYSFPAAPTFGAPIEEVLAYYAANRDSVAIAAGLGNLAIAGGSALLFVGLAGFAAWLVWLLATGVRLVRGDVD